MITQQTIDGLKLWQFSTLASQEKVKHFVSDRKSFDHNDFNVSYSTSPDPQLVKVNRTRLAESMGLKFDKLYLPKQVHKDHIVKVDVNTSHEMLEETDALISNDPEVGIAVMSADCVPILLYDPKKQAVGAVHSGWKGTVALILTKTLQAMEQAFGSKPDDIIAAIGPSVCQVSYEVGQEVIDAIRNSYSNAETLLMMQENGKAKLDLWKANQLQLTASGVKPENIEVAGTCTVIYNQHFFSARKGDSGRFAAGIRLLPY